MDPILHVWKSLRPEQVSALVKRRAVDHAPVRDLVVEFGVSRATVKDVLKKHGIQLPKDVAQANVQAGMDRMSPEVKAARQRAQQTPAARAKRRATAAKTWEDPELRKLKGRQSSAWWASLTPEAKRAQSEHSSGPRSARSIEARGEHCTSGARYRAHAAEAGGDYLGPEDASTHDKVAWRCGKGHDFVSMAYSVLAGHWCPRCVDQISKPQLQIVDFVQTLLPPGSVRVSCRDVISPYELDVYVPDKRFAVEYNGLFWHSSACPGWKPGREAKKAAMCRAKGISLLMIYQDEWAQRRPLVEAMIRHRLGAVTGRADARKLSLVALEDHREVDAFLDAHHLGGAARFTFGYGLRDAAGVLLAVATARKSHQHEWELARFATRGDVVVRGAAGRLVAAIRARVAGPLVSYSDNRLSGGGVYRQLGFVEVTKTTSPSYYYTDGTRRLWRFRCRRSSAPEILEKYKTEREQVLAGVFSEKYFGDRRPLFKIEDAGHRKWLLT